MNPFRLKMLGGLLLFSIAAPLMGVWWFSEHPLIRPRLKLIRLKTLGALPQESWPQIIRRTRPSSLAGASSVPRLLKELPVTNVLDSPGDLEAGEQLFRTHCAQCHAKGESAGGPDLTSPSLRRKFQESEIYWAISEGIEGSSMPRFRGTETEVLQLTTFVASLVDRDAEREGHTLTIDRACPSCESPDVSYEDLRNAVNDSSQWLTYSGSYTGQRFSSLQQINRATISRLRPRWIHQMKSLQAVESHPLVAGGMMFLTGPANEVIALDAGTGEPRWTFTRPILENVPQCCGRVNRGVAILGRRVYHGTLDGRLIALDAAEGRLVWDVEVAKPSAGYSLTGAPLAVKDKIIVGVAGGDFGARGFLDAYDAETGKRVWRFDTVPGPGEDGHESWENEAWKTGGGGTWITGSFDPDLNLLYWGVGNPAPTYDGDYRPGDNLYTCSVIALDPDTGELKWHYQFSPHDTNDWDAALVPVLADLEYGGEVRKLMLWANRNCFFYILDRKTGQFLQAKEYCEQNWNDGFTSEGRPIRRPGTRPTEEGVMIQPSPYGGSNWWSPAYSPRTELYYIAHHRMTEIVRQSAEEFTPGRIFNRGWSYAASKVPRASGVRAIQAVTGEVVWDKVFESRLTTKAGTLVTAGDLVFTASGSGTLIALDARTGEEVWKMSLGGRVAMGPVTYLHEGRQNLAVIAANTLVVLDLAGEPAEPQTSSPGGRQHPETPTRSTNP